MFYLQDKFETSSEIILPKSNRKILFFENNHINKNLGKNKIPYAAYFDNELLIKLKKGKTTKNFLASLNKALNMSQSDLNIIDSISGKGVFLVKSNNFRFYDFKNIESSLLQTGVAEFVEPNFVYKLQSNQFPVSYDPGQWNLRNDGSLNPPQGKYDADVDGIEAISHFLYGAQIKKEIVVSVIDSGIDVNHPSLSTALWNNPSEIPNNGFDDDGNGLVDDIYGWNFASNNRNLHDNDSHGTHVSGIIAGRTTPYRKFTGVAPKSKLLIAKTSENNLSSMMAISKAIYYSIDKKADIINMSLGGYTYSQILADAVNEALKQDIVVVAAAGNDAIDIGVTPVYPGSIQRVFCIASTDKNDNISPTSNFQSNNTGQIQAIQIAAPGEYILSTTPTGYGFKNGTSMAAPHVTGAIALIKGLFPQSNTVDIRKRLLNGADILSSLEFKVMDKRRLNIYRSLNQIKDFLSIGGEPYANEIYDGQPRNQRYPFANSGEPGIDGKNIHTAYKISSIKQLMNIGKNPEFANKFYRLTNNLDWNDLMPSERSTISQTFNGKIYGEGFCIKNFNLNTKLSYVGIFRLIGPGGEINDLKFTNAAVSGVSKVGIVAGEIYNGLLNNVSVEGNVQGDFYYVGGLVGESSGTIFRSCFFEGMIESKSNFSGGISGRSINNSAFLQCHVQALIKSHANAGGLTGFLKDSHAVNNYCNVNMINTNLSNTLGGIIGSSENCQIENCYSEGFIDANNTSGGLVGSAKNTRVTNSYSTTYVSQSEDSGGLIGKGQQLTFINSYYHVASRAGAGGTGKYLSDLKKRETFVGWWQEGVWRIFDSYTPLLRNIPRCNYTLN